MKIYRVGGSVRDELLGLPVHDADWVVVGATPQQMLDLGYQPVGKDFPVFLHPDTHEEYALARTERKTAPGYRGFTTAFSPDVTLDDDLLRRDLTINAMARDHDGSLIDPHGGHADLRAKVFRHVSAAFAEDPVRILRLARFAARFPEFETAPETVALMRSMVAVGEADTLVPERVWQEISRGLMAQSPARMIEELETCGALPRLVPGMIPSTRLLRALDHAALHGAPLASRFALLALACPDSATGAALATHLRAPNDCAAIAQAVLAEREQFDAVLDKAETLRDDVANGDQAARTNHLMRDAGPATLLHWLERCDALRRPERLSQIMAAVTAWTEGRLHTFAERLEIARAAAAHVDAGAIARPLASQGPEAIAHALREARLAAIGKAVHAE